jgi:predicted phosphohydrolase
VEARKKHDFWKQCHPALEEKTPGAAAVEENNAQEAEAEAAAEEEEYALAKVSDEELGEMSKNLLKQEIAKLEKITQESTVHNGAIRE